jgi:hypothetical protein
MDALTAKNYKIVNSALQLFLAILKSTVDAGAIPNQIHMPMVGGNTTFYQVHVTNIQFGKQRPKNKRKFSGEKTDGQGEAQVQSLRPSRIKVLKGNNML